MTLEQFRATGRLVEDASTTGIDNLEDSHGQAMVYVDNLYMLSSVDWMTPEMVSKKQHWWTADGNQELIGTLAECEEWLYQAYLANK